MKQCINCGDELIVGENCRGYRAIFCDKPECQQARQQRRKTAAAKASKKQASKRQKKNRFCLNCGDLLARGKNCKSNAAKYCDKPECQEAKDNRLKEYRNKYLTEAPPASYIPESYSNFTPVEPNKYTKCIFCGSKEPLNRFGVCRRCYSYRVNEFTEIEASCTLRI